VDFKRRYGLRNDTSRCGDTGFSNRYAGTYQRSCADPGSIFDYNRERPEPERLIGPIVIARAKIRSLRDTGILPNPDLNEVVNPDVLSDPTMGTDEEPPWVFHSYARL
jgi:hypothetical protein